MSSFNTTFHSREEALRRPLSAYEVGLLRISGVLHVLAWIICIGMPIALGICTIWLWQQPYWSMPGKELSQATQQIDTYEKQRSAYIDTVQHLNQRIRFDLVANAFLVPPPTGIRLEVVTYKNAYLASQLYGTISGMGSSSTADEAFVEKYLASVEATLKHNLPERRIKIALKEHVPDKQNGGVKFSFTGIIQ